MNQVQKHFDRQKSANYKGIDSENNVEQGLNDNTGTILLSSKLNAGNSGGPVVNTKGCLIGVAVGKLDTKKMLTEIDLLAEDMNIAIKPSEVASFFGNKNNLKCNNVKTYSRVELYEYMLPRVVLIIAGN